MEEKSSQGGAGATGNSLGKHILVEYHGCDTAVINDSKSLDVLLVESANLAGATVIKSVFHNFSPVGVSGVVVIAESHFAVHTWPEHGYAAVDFFTCSDTMDYVAAYTFLKEKLKASKASFKIVERGLMEDLAMK